jgi:type III secretory pathway component EscR
MIGLLLSLKFIVLEVLLSRILVGEGRVSESFGTFFLPLKRITLASHLVEWVNPV